jgi:hypothetical protein
MIPQTKVCNLGHHMHRGQERKPDQELRLELPEQGQEAKRRKFQPSIEYMRILHEPTH